MKDEREYKKQGDIHSAKTEAKMMNYKTRIFRTISKQKQIKMVAIRTVLLSLALSLASSSHAEEPMPRERVVLPSKTSLDFFNHLNGPARWQFGPTLVLSLRMWGESTIFLLNGDQEVFRLNAPEYVRAAVLSEDRKSLVMVVMETTGSGSAFAALLRIQPDGSKLKIDRVLESGQKLFNRRWLLSELGAVSNDGATILAKFSVEDAASGRMVHRWHTVDLDNRRILSEGLTIPTRETERGVLLKPLLVGVLGTLSFSFLAVLLWRKFSRTKAVGDQAG